MKKIAGGDLFENRDDVSINPTSDRAFYSFSKHIFLLVLILIITLNPLCKESLNSWTKPALNTLIRYI